MTAPTPLLRVAFRTDAAIEIGTGHVMRCLTLAAALREQGAECVFLCRPHEGQLLDLIAAQGHHAQALPALAPAAAPSSQDPGDPPHAAWVGTGWSEDARDSRRELDAHAGGGRFDWLVVDHYGLDARWERALRPMCRHLMVIDDLADRPHDCDLLLDHGFGRVAADYTALIGARPAVLLGPRYALLRREFALLRGESLARRKTIGIERVLVTMGGVDKDNITVQVLPVLDAALARDVRITVVMGATAPWIDAVRARVTGMRHPTEVRVDVQDMARLMAESDLAIGAGGTTAWERCALGLPSITIVLAKNQEGIAGALHDAGATIALHPDVKGFSRLGSMLSGRSLPEQLGRMSRAAARITDGHGVHHVIRKMRALHHRGETNRPARELSAWAEKRSDQIDNP